MRTIFEAYGLWEEIEETPRVCGDGAAFAKAILLANMHSPFMQSRVISGSDALTCTRFNKWEVEDENVAFIWRRLQGTMKDDRIELYVYGRNDRSIHYAVEL